MCVCYYIANRAKEIKVLEDIVALIPKYLDNAGPYGLVIVLLIVACGWVARSLHMERKRNDRLVLKMQEMSKETLTMIERLAGNK